MSILDGYVEAGGNFIDTADVYSRWVPGHGGGESETVIGDWIAARNSRDQVIIATKCGVPMGTGENEKGLSRHHIMAAVEASLRRLRTDYIDLYQAHIDDSETPLEETLRAFDDLVTQGKVRYIGASNYSAWRLMRAIGESERRNLVRYESIQPRYNLVDRADYERELEPMCREMEIGVICYSSLASGFLTGKYRKGGTLPDSPRAGGIEKRYMASDKAFAVLATVERIAESCKATHSSVALAWLMARPGITAPIASATSTDQLTSLIEATEMRLAPEEIAELETASAWKKPT
jgi:aryl-alcohol dehydrogenase-like predicted oxidoreductase